MTSKRPSFTDEEALDFHSQPHPGKISMVPTKPMGTQRDLSLAYSPGVAIPVLAISEDEDKAYDYTSKGNLVAVISNGTAILGLGNLGPMASKPVMEGKSVLFKRFADIDSFDIEVDTTDVEEFISTVRNIGSTWGGINLEDISSPDCFIIESRLREELDIPVFHDDQHGTAIIAAAGLINACHITGRNMEDLKVAVSGAGAAGLSVAGLIRHLGVKAENIVMCDSSGVVYEGRTEKMDQFKSAFAIKTSKRTLAEACEGADCLLGLSAKGAVTKDMVKSMAKDPIIFAMANPDPEITPEDIKSVRDDAIIATGRSDYPNQVNNVLGFPYIFRGALDVRARGINEEMKVAAAHAIAELAREDVPDEVAAAYHGARPSFGREYIIPTPFDPRLISFIPPFVAQAAMDTGVARKPINDMEAYRHSLARRADPSAAFIQGVQAHCKENQRRIVFAEGEEPAVVRAAFSFKNQGLGHPILIGREAQVQRAMEQMGIQPGSLEIINARLSDNNPLYTDMLYSRLQRDGYLKRDAQRLVNQDRNVFGCCMLKNGDADGMVTGVTRNYDVALNDALLVLDPIPGQAIIGMSMVINRGRTVFIADTSVTELPQGQDLANIAIEAARGVRALGFTPRVAFLSYSTFGNPMGERGEKVREAVAILDSMKNIDFEYEGDMNADVALNTGHKLLYPFSRLTGPANVLVMPAIHAASISTKLLESMSRATVIGPMLLGLEKPVQIASLGATVGDIVNLATIAAFDVDDVHTS
ncbi:NADP-dependent malic enzyme [Hyphomonas pacifica]|uniref:Malic enzyme n=1 Tax=Hyphomonas pacifica TaxID=1280941 RepID=A0A062TXH3_9PROT|nr:NADP-dependent malic enzyme [Hyphomonas pacifica]MAN44699.1 NADP-dependent malic enzyme [Hyphomonas sp.]MBR9808352.1 NADP-dependent malic enzyme [Alphaproteobacteria bacterium]KCZ45463.1 malic enzyme [Hyphomonas pacifica]RAN35635.1 malic enzyme [Hyphomonas pacifica]RAN36540.1 malic enzyme [Hyphomonas pacifica]